MIRFSERSQAKSTPSGLSRTGGDQHGKERGALTPNFAEKLSRLFDECRSPDGRRYTNLEVVEAINATKQARISPSYLSELLSGKKDNPSLWTVKALADFFGQPMDYFVEPDLSPRTRAALPFEKVGTAAGEWTLGARLNLLFAMAAHDGSAPPTNAQVAAIANSRLRRAPSVHSPAAVPTFSN